MSTSTWNPARRFPWLGDSLPCPSPAELKDLAAEDRAATVRLYGEQRVAELEQEANRGRPRPDYDPRTDWPERYGRV